MHYIVCVLCDVRFHVRILVHNETVRGDGIALDATHFCVFVLTDSVSDDGLVVSHFQSVYGSSVEWWLGQAIVELECVTAMVYLAFLLYFIFYKVFYMGDLACLGPSEAFTSGVKTTWLGRLLSPLSCGLRASAFVVYSICNIS